MAFENLMVERREHLLWITVNRPKKLNALNVATIGELEVAVTEAAADSEVWAVVLTGAGDRAFVAGADIQELNSLGAVQAKAFAERGQAVFSLIEGMAKPTVAAVNGFALGGGCELAMACHLRVASSNAVFGQPEVKLGLIPGYGGTQRLPRLVGRGRALEILLSGRNVDAAEALQIGLVNRVAEAAELEEVVQDLLKPILFNGPLAVAHCIEAVNRGLGLTLDQGLAVEASLFGVGAADPEMEEGTLAFLEKRRAAFRGAR
ncbi:MAG: enoyl-CoA hydratase/isomerase family protein [Thermoanaerobaculales bacterium]|nr:enoyl-CoA hydratase/isomerase family protein [Thermoanaerobaculales bacterium]